MVYKMYGVQDASPTGILDRRLYGLMTAWLADCVVCRLYSKVVVKFGSYINHRPIGTENFASQAMLQNKPL